MKLIDIDKLVVIDNHIHYLKVYRGSVILMDKSSKIYRFNIQFSIEYKPIGNPDIAVKFLDHPHFPITGIMKKVKKRIQELDDKGILSNAHD